MTNYKLQIKKLKNLVMQYLSRNKTSMTVGVIKDYMAQETYFLYLLDTITINSSLSRSSGGKGGKS